MDAEDWDRRYGSTELVWSAEPNRFLADAVEGLGPGRALDLACGEGRNAIWLAERGWRVTAVDFSAVALAKAARLGASRGVAVEWVHADLRGWVPDGAGFDLVAVVYVHMPGPARSEMISTAAASLAPGGTFVWVGHDLDNLAHGVGGPQDPGVLSTVDEVVAAMGGLTIVSAGQVRRPVEVDPGHGHGHAGEAIDQVVVARRA